MKRKRDNKQKKKYNSLPYAHCFKFNFLIKHSKYFFIDIISLFYYFSNQSYFG